MIVPVALFFSLVLYAGASLDDDQYSEDTTALIVLIAVWIISILLPIIAVIGDLWRRSSW